MQEERINLLDLHKQEDLEPEEIVLDIKASTEESKELSSDDEPWVPDHQFSFCYGCYCLFLVTCCFVHYLWARTAISGFYGYADPDKMLDPYYAMQMDKDYGLCANTYANLSTICPAVF